MSQALTDWTAATGSMPWGVQRAFKDALGLVAEGKVKMVWGADSYNGSPCLVNAISSMIHSSTEPDGAISPSSYASAVVSAFDRVNDELRTKVPDATDIRYVSEFAAEVLLKHFGAEAPQPADVEPITVTDAPYVEVSDEDIMNEWLAAQTKPAEQECAPLPEMSQADMEQIESFLRG